MKSILIFVLASLFATVESRCDNACSGHGTCNIRTKCDCYDNFGIGMGHESGDCSDRICPYDISWIDKPDKNGEQHNYAECSSKGICDRSTGLCTCFSGYEGKACQRSNYNILFL